MRLIDADALVFTETYRAKNASNEKISDAYRQVLWDIAHCETIEAEPVRHSYWTRDGECNGCGELGLYNGNEEIVRARWCPHCGAKMEGSVEDD